MSLRASTSERALFGACWDNLSKKEKLKVIFNAKIPGGFNPDFDTFGWNSFNSNNQVRLINSMGRLGVNCFT